MNIRDVHELSDGKSWEGRTFSVYPQEGTRGLPVLEYTALKEPLSCAIVMCSDRNIMIGRWVWRRKPSKKVIPKLVHCEMFKISNERSSKDMTHCWSGPICYRRPSLFSWRCAWSSTVPQTPSVPPRMLIGLASLDYPLYRFFRLIYSDTSLDNNLYSGRCISTWDWLTHSSTFQLFGCNPKNHQNFHHNIYEPLWHGHGRWYFGIYLESEEEGFDAVEQVDQCVLACTSIFNGLEDLNVKLSIWWVRKGRTRRKMPMPAKMAFAGENI